MTKSKTRSQDFERFIHESFFYLNQLLDAYGSRNIKTAEKFKKAKKEYYKFVSDFLKQLNHEKEQRN